MGSTSFEQCSQVKPSLSFVNLFFCIQLYIMLLQIREKWFINAGMLGELLRAKVFHRPVGVWIQLIIFVIFLVWSPRLHSLMSLALFFPYLLIIAAAICLIRKRMSGYVLCFSADIFMIFMSLFLSLKMGMTPSISVMVFSAIGMICIRANRKWFDENIST